jgi:5'(3')-deoxyribonucleotidase
MMKMFLDFDDTIVNSRKKYCEVYSKLYCDHEGYSPPDWRNVKHWDLSKACPLVDMDLFSHDLFFYDLEFVDGAYEHIKALARDLRFTVIICSIGTYGNVAKKAMWIKNHLPFVNYSIFINNGHNHMDKSIIDMKGGILVDDVSSNLYSSNASVKICFGDILPWNEDWTCGKRCRTWKELYWELTNGDVLVV